MGTRTKPPPAPTNVPNAPTATPRGMSSNSVVSSLTLQRGLRSAPHYPTSPRNIVRAS